MDSVISIRNIYFLKFFMYLILDFYLLDFYSLILPYYFFPYQKFRPWQVYLIMFMVHTIPDREGRTKTIFS